ncbi:hypothetical protein EYF80_037929 [Liparis tanakae]|uniref:Uncharacterized protein n=1 Tax=Liparis tanakae TaxID=230148 RepID=A0A4Z2GG03_9TELE|nr:hypothetical protein EYF80_037929 [Liparis tanakae]
MRLLGWRRSSGGALRGQQLEVFTCRSLSLCSAAGRRRLGTPLRRRSTSAPPPLLKASSFEELPPLRGSKSRGTVAGGRCRTERCNEGKGRKESGGGRTARSSAQRDVTDVGRNVWVARSLLRVPEEPHQWCTSPSSSSTLLHIPTSPTAPAERLSGVKQGALSTSSITPPQQIPPALLSEPR